MSAPPLNSPVDLSHHFSESAKNHTPSSIKKFYKFFQIPGIGNLAGGLPNPSLFPFDTLEAQVAKPERWTPSPNYRGGDDDEGGDDVAAGLAAASLSDKADPAAGAHITVPRKTGESDPTKRIDLATGLQYGTADGYPPLHSFIRQFARDHLHPVVPYEGGPEVILTTGSTDGFAKATEMLVEPWSLNGGDRIENRPAMLTEVFVYNNAPANVAPKGVRIVPVEIDGQGMLAKGPGGLEDILDNWDLTQGRRPHLLYTVSIGHNPTGGVQSVERRREIYALCVKYDIIIIEDDPYWYLQFPSAAASEAASRGQPAPPAAEAHRPARSSGYEFLDSLTPSYLSIDRQGRVIRLDTFSKTIAPGCRLGWITAQPALIERIARITETNTQQPSGFVQTMVAEAIMGPQQPPAALSAFWKLPGVLERRAFTGWDVDGWVRWLAGLRGVYERRMTRMCAALDAGSHQLKQSTPKREGDAEWGVITKTRLMSFSWPRGGMFVWVRLHLENHPLWMARGRGGSVPVLDGPMLAAALMIYLTHRPNLILAAPGTMFGATEAVSAERGWRFMRLCFAAEDEAVVEPCARRFADGVQKFWRIKSAAEMERLIEEANADSVEEQAGLVNLGYPMGC